MLTGVRVRRAFCDWLEGFSSNVADVLIVLGEWYPDISRQLGNLQDQLHQEAEEMRVLSEAEMNHVYQDCQSWCDRMASLLRGIGKSAAHEYPELGAEFRELSERASELLADYKRRMGIRNPVEKQQDIERQLVGADY